jgi:H+-translocating NAD(P) transhydrogenase subunit alpha
MHGFATEFRNFPFIILHNDLLDFGNAPQRCTQKEKSMLIGVPKETFAGEKRVATVPDVVEKLVKLGFEVAVESGAGDAANFADDTYRAAGATVVPTAHDIWAKSDIVFKVRPPSADEVASCAKARPWSALSGPRRTPT